MIPASHSERVPLRISDAAVLKICLTCQMFLAKAPDECDKNSQLVTSPPEMISQSFFLSNTAKDADRKTRGFSLIEVAMAVGILGSVFALLTGLMASGLQVFHESTDRVVSAQISQRLLNELGQTEWQELFDTDQGSAATFPVRYFSKTGDEVDGGASEAIYLARPVIFAPGQNETLTVAETDYSAMGDPRFVRVVVEVFHSPAGEVPPTGASGLWESGKQDRVKRLSTMVVRNR